MLLKTCQKSCDMWIHKYTIYLVLFSFIDIAELFIIESLCSGNSLGELGYVCSFITGSVLCRHLHFTWGTKDISMGYSTPIHVFAMQRCWAKMVASYFHIFSAPYSFRLRILLGTEEQLPFSLAEYRILDCISLAYYRIWLKAEL